MQFGFFHTALLGGLLLASLPILIHLINRRRARIVPFAAFRFVQLSNKKLARSIKIKQILLLLLRILLVVLAVLIVARPFTTPENAVEIAAAQNRPASRVILLDTSLSMQAMRDGRSLFELARKKSYELLQSFPTTDLAAIVPFSRAEPREPTELTFDRAALLDTLDKITPGYLSTDLSMGIERALALLRESPQELKIIYLVGDFSHGYRLESSPLPGNPDDPLLIPVDVREGKPLPNLSVEEITAEKTYVGGRPVWSIKATVANWGAEALEGVPISLVSEGNTVAGGFLDLSPRSREVKEFVHGFASAGVLDLEVRLPDDILEADNRRSLVIDTGREVRALIVSGEPSTIRLKDEAFYLASALDPAGDGRSQVHVKQVTVDQLPGMTFEEFDVVFLCHMSLLPLDAAMRIREFVYGGGGLFISTGAKLAVDDLNEGLSPLLPGRLRGSKAARVATASEESAAALHLSQLDFTHPVFRVFDEETAASLYHASFEHHFLYDPDPAKPKTILARYTNHQPALVEVAYGSGRAILYTSTVDRQWTNLPIQPGFLALMQETAHYLSGRTDNPIPQVAEVGSKYVVAAADLEENVEVLSPDGRKTELATLDGELQVPFVDRPGIWRVKGKTRSSIFAAGLDPEESDLKPMESGDFAVISGQLRPLGQGNDGGLRTEWAGTLMGLILLAFLAEALLLRWMG